MSRAPDWAIKNVRAVVGDRIIPDASVVVRDGLIVAVEERPVRNARDGEGALLIPGLIDLHSDALEAELRPRPNVEMPWDYALHALEQRLIGSGVTTAFHGVRFQHQTPDGLPWLLEQSVALAGKLDGVRAGAVDHRVLHRVDVRSAAGLAAWQERFDAVVASDAPLVSHEDHAPGQGQYADPAQLMTLLRRRGLGVAEAADRVAGLVALGHATEATKAMALSRLGGLAVAGRIRLVGHDLDSPDAVDSLVARGGVAAEFPTVAEAARRARARGLAVIAGAPNAIRGASHNGNVSTRDLVAEGAVDALASDYVPHSLLAATYLLHRSGLCSLPEAVALVTSGPAAIAGLTDRGRLAVGLSADLVLVEDRRGPWPRVIACRRGSGHTTE